ncbi:hypothetical protein [Spiroplasma endosymbiont of Polydrusus pterygomalis]|uniref:hypothetical protein n=1 Tax=Spiroplasma endosymbiont of Polydrusus pterygomalis TaxID=3139327 RepID=UPI003CCB09A5
MPRISLKVFKKIISSKYSEQSTNIQNVLIEIGDDLYAKSETLAILKTVTPVINPLTVKKIVSLNSDQKLTIDSAISTNTFILDEELTEDEKHLFQKDQLLFVEDDHDNTKIKVYKILFNESEGENSAELVELRAIPLTTFNDLFINSGLFKDDNLIFQKINTLLQDSSIQNSFYELVWNQEHFNAIDYSSNIAVIKDFKKHLKLNNVEKDYFFYRQGNEVIIKNISNPNDTFKVQINVNTINNNDILYLNKSAGENGEVCWKVYKITKTIIPGWIYNNVKYQAYEVQSLTDQEFNDLSDLLSIIPQSGFTISAENDNGLASCLTTEQKNIGSAGVFYCKKRWENPSERETLSEPLAIADDNVATIRAVFANKSQEGLYSLVIADDKVKITDLKSEPENLFFEQPLFPENKRDWSRLLNTNRHYKKVYFVKNLNNDLVEKWVVNNEQDQLQCVQIVELADLRKNFANNNLFYVPELIATEGIHLGENGAEVAANASQHHATTSSAVAIYNVINLKWDNGIKMWNLNVTTHENTLDTKLKFEEKESLILKKIMTATNNANTVILFNKYDGKFLRAYYINENNKKVNCSNILTTEEKNCLSNINKKAKERVEKPIVVNPKCYSKSNDKIFKLSYFNNKWHVLCTEKYEVTKQIKAEIKLTEEEGDLLSKLVYYSRDIDITFDKNNNFKVIKYVNFLDKDESSFIKNDSLLTDVNSKLLQKVFTAINDKENLKPENNDLQWKLWDCSTNTTVNNISVPAVTDSSDIPVTL